MAEPKMVTDGKDKKTFDSDFCGSIPLNFINLVQRHGVLLVLDKSTYEIVQVSDNCREILNIDVEEILNKRLADFISPQEMSEMNQKIESVNISLQLPLNLGFNVDGNIKLCTCTVHSKESYILLEVEKEKPVEGNKSFTYLHQQIKFIMGKLKEANSIKRVCQIVAEEIKQLSFFDRVLIYKFDEDWNGIVQGEAKEEDQDSFLNLRFPASDIPKQARELYFKNPYRLIPDRTAKPARLFPVINSIIHGFTDLSDCNLRSVPAVHLEYLKNMNVVASMSTPIIRDGKLWGLISCHHKTEKYPSYEMISGFELLSGIISTQIVARENEILYRNKENLVRQNGKILEKLYSEDSLVRSILEGNDNIMELLSLTGAVLIDSNGVFSKGKTPSSEKLKSLIDWLERRNINKIFSTSCLPKIYPEGEGIKDIAAGLMVIPIDFSKGFYLLGFRQEWVFTIEWGGNPYEAIQMESDGKNYHPRNSFCLWQETVKNTSKPWLEEQMEAAETLRGNILQKIVLNNK